MITTILLCWYALGWNAILVLAREFDEITILGALFGFLFAPLAFPIWFLMSEERAVLWRKL